MISLVLIIPCQYADAGGLPLDPRRRTLHRKPSYFDEFFFSWKNDVPFFHRAWKGHVLRRNFEPNEQLALKLNLPKHAIAGSLLDSFQHQFDSKRRRWRIGMPGGDGCWMNFANFSNFLIGDICEAVNCGKTPFLLNIGAADGRGAGPMVDPLSDFVLKTPAVRGIFFEPKDHMFALLERNMADRLGIIVSKTALSPSNVAHELSAIQEEVAILKVDIDSFDCALIDAIMSLQSIRPYVIVMEVEHAIPPPVMCARIFGSPAWRSEDLNRGCSLSYAVAMCWRHGYFLFRFSGHDAAFIRHDQISAVRHLAPGGVPADEFACFAEMDYEYFEYSRKTGAFGSFFFPLRFVQDLFFVQDAETQLALVRGNISRLYADDMVCSLRWFPPTAQGLHQYTQRLQADAASFDRHLKQPS